MENDSYVKTSNDVRESNLIEKNKWVIWSDWIIQTVIKIDNEYDRKKA